MVLWPEGVVLMAGEGEEREVVRGGEKREEFVFFFTVLTKLP